MFCSKCHAGSDTCVFQNMGEQTVTIPTNDEGAVEHVLKVVFLCPQCGEVAHDHLGKSPFKPGTRTLSGKSGSHNKNKKKPRKLTEAEEDAEAEEKLKALKKIEAPE